MRFVFKCLAIHHVSGRVTLFPLDLPELAVHATTLQRAAEELTLALDDRICRAHPRRLIDFAKPASGEPLPLEVPILPVRRAEAELDETRPLRLNAVLCPAHKPYVEVRLPRVGVRYWVRAPGASAAAAPATEATQLLGSELARLSDDALLALRPEGAETLVDIEVDATPLRLSDLKRRELTQDERAPPRPPDAERDDRAIDDDEEQHASAADEDDWDDTPKKARKKAEPKRPDTPSLRRLGTPWHQLAADGELPEAWERDALVETLRARLAAPEPDPIVLVGPSGAGKTAILHELARRLASDANAQPRAGAAAGRKKGARVEYPGLRPFWFIDGSRLIAGQGAFGEWQRQTLDVLSEARGAGALLCLGHIVGLLDAGRSAHTQDNVAQLIAPALGAREVAVIGEATPEEWAQVERRNQAFARAFAVVRVEEPPPEATARILTRAAQAIAAERRIQIAPDVPAEVLSVSARFQPYGALLGNAVALLARLCDARAHALAGRVDARDAIAHFSSESGIPEVLLRDDVPLDDEEVRAFLGARVKGQAEAVARVAEVVAVIKANLADRRRPSAVLLFAGPTGVGKTELAKALAEFVFGSRERMVRLDMGEYAGPDALSRLVGEEGRSGHLTSAVRRQPFSVVLLDEIEKAHPAVFDALLGVLGEGRLTDASGRLTDFRASVIVMTSNLGAETARARPGFGEGAAPGGASRHLTAHYRGEAQRFFRPELFNRLDEVVVFSPLGAREIGAIVGRELARVHAREGLRRRDVQLAVDDDVATLIAARGVDPRYGARPLKRAIERELVAPVAAWLADHKPEGAVRLVASLAPNDSGASMITLGAESLGGAAEGFSRAAIERVLAHAARLRGEVRRWSRSKPMRDLQSDLALFDRQSRMPAFWHDRDVADDRSRAAAEVRDLTVGLRECERAAETAEDLAWEAYYARQVAAARSLEADLARIEAQLGPLGERLVCALYPPRRAATLFFLAGRGAQEHVRWLARGYLLWAERRGGTARVLVAKSREPRASARADKKPSPPPPRSSRRGGGATKDASPTLDKPKGRKKAAALEWRWVQHALDDHVEAPLAIEVEGASALMLLAAEHGQHRFIDGGGTHLVRVWFVAGRISPFPDPPALEATMPVEEVRRLWPDKRLVRDLRTGEDYTLGDEHFDPSPAHADWIRLRVFGADGRER